MTFREDHEHAAREHSARQTPLDAGAASLPPPPWLNRPQPPASYDLVRFAVWRGQSAAVADDEVEAALALLPAARDEIEQLETAMLFIARAQGWPWGRIARAMGLGSAQAALQRYDRLVSRTGYEATS